MAESAVTANTDGATGELAARLRAAVRGEVLDDAMSLGLYATDASMFQITPLAVVLPLDRADALAAIRCCGEAGVPILPRGGGTSLSGQTIARAVVIDCSKHMTRLLELNVEGRWARVEPGLVRDNLNAVLLPHGLHFAPDPATTSRANIGGMIANNAAGMRSILYGTTIHHILGADLALATGEVLNLGPIDEAGLEAKSRLRDREGEIYRGFRALIDRNRDEILARYPKVLRRSGGYMLDAFAGPLPWNMARIIAASEGTLGLLLEATVRLEPLPRLRGLCIPHFATLQQCLAAVAPIVALGPSAVEVTDGIIIDRARKSLLTRDLCGYIEGEPAGILTVEFSGDDGGEIAEKLERVAALLKGMGLCYACPVMLGAREQANAWTMRENALGLMTTVRGDRKPVPFIEDAAVPVESLHAYITEVFEICAKHGRKVSVFAHASVGLIHVRPLLDLHQPEEMAVFHAIQEEVFEAVVRYKGSWSGEHGDGMVRAQFNERFFGPQLYGAFMELKRLFDPRGLMNPGKIVDTPPVEENMRFFPGYSQQFEQTMFHYRDQEGFRRAVEQCTGVGACRKTLAGTMCPSYRATRDEEHSTRGRANALRLAMTGQLGPGAMGSDRLREVLDLCLACKACAAECPNSVDMSRMKAEVLHQHHLAHGSSAGERMIADQPRRAGLAAGRPWSGLVNMALASAPGRAALERVAGIDRRRTLPAFASETMSQWFRARGGPIWTGAEGALPPTPPDGRTLVALFCDSWMENYEPEVGRAAVEMLEASGCDVLLARPGCCQRPAISKGFLDQARREGEATLRRLAPLAAQGIPILVCEPSCATALAQDLPDLVGDEALGAGVAAAVEPIEHYLDQALRAGRLKFATPGAATGDTGPLLLHGHCHQKALFGMAATLDLLAGAGLAPRLIDAGCCGMAGSFGYEKKHYDLSMQIGEDRLFPAIRAAGPDARLAATGFSCRHQIADGTGKRALHPVELVRDRIG